jgi:hypothetical protein
LALILTGCSQPKQNADESASSVPASTDAGKNAVKAEDTLQSLINANINKQPTIDTIFLGFSFDMTKAQAMAHYGQMIKEKKLVMNEKDQRYEYPMTFDLVKANASIAPEFQGNKLYKLTLVIEPADDLGTNETVYLQAAVAYMKKYNGYSLFQEPDPIEPNEKKFHWIKNNLHIFLHKTVDGSIVSYINMPVEKLIDKKNSTQTDSTKAQTTKDI